MITADRLKELFMYDEYTGQFFRKKVRAGGKNPAGSYTWAGYLVISVDCRLYRAHRLAWLYVHGKFPDGDIDHINGNKADNRICNLRDVSRSVNMQNLKRSHKDSSVGLLGVVLSHHKTKPYRAMLSIRGKRIYSEYFKTPEEAHRAYMEMKSHIYGKE